MAGLPHGRGQALDAHQGRAGKAVWKVPAGDLPCAVFTLTSMEYKVPIEDFWGLLNSPRRRHFSRRPRYHGARFPAAARVTERWGG